MVEKFGYLLSHQSKASLGPTWRQCQAVPSSCKPSTASPSAALTCVWPPRLAHAGPPSECRCRRGPVEGSKARKPPHNTQPQHLDRQLWMHRHGRNLCIRLSSLMLVSSAAAPRTAAQTNTPPHLHVEHGGGAVDPQPCNLHGAADHAARVVAQVQDEGLGAIALQAGGAVQAVSRPLFMAGRVLFAKVQREGLAAVEQSAGPANTCMEHTLSW